MKHILLHFLLLSSMSLVIAQPGIFVRYCVHNQGPQTLFYTTSLQAQITKSAGNKMLETGNTISYQEFLPGNTTAFHAELVDNVHSITAVNAATLVNNAGYSSTTPSSIFYFNPIDQGTFASTLNTGNTIKFFVYGCTIDFTQPTSNLQLICKLTDATTPTNEFYTAARTNPPSWCVTNTNAGLNIYP